MPKGLDPDATYSVNFAWSKILTQPYPDSTGDGLMKIGIRTYDAGAFHDAVYDCFVIELETK